MRIEDPLSYRSPDERLATNEARKEEEKNKKQRAITIKTGLRDPHTGMQKMPSEEALLSIYQLRQEFKNTPPQGTQGSCASYMTGPHMWSWSLPAPFASSPSSNLLSRLPGISRNLLPFLLYMSFYFGDVSVAWVENTCTVVLSYILRNKIR